MLILTRRVQESLNIGDDVTVTVLSVKGNQVRLGINAPNEIEVHREEIYKKVKDKKEDEIEIFDSSNRSYPTPKKPMITFKKSRKSSFTA